MNQNPPKDVVEVASHGLFSVAFHARPTFGPAEGAEIVVPISAAMELERRLLVIASDAACVNDEWLAQQQDGIRSIIANIRRHANLTENVNMEARDK